MNKIKILNKSLRIFTLAITLVALQCSNIVNAQTTRSPATLRKMGVYFVDPESSVATCGSFNQGLTRDGNPYHVLSYPSAITDDAKAAEAINTFINNKWPASPFKGLGSSFVAGAKRSNVNPFLAVAHLQNESGMATSPILGWHNTKPPSYNGFGRRATKSQPHTTYTTNEGRQNLVYQWTSWQASVDDGENGDDWFKLIRDTYLAPNGTFMIDSGDFSAYVGRYAPQSDGNNEQSYITGLLTTIDNVAAAMNNTLTTTVTQSPQALQCNGTASVSEVVYYSQVDPKWATHPFPYSGDPTNEADRYISTSGCGPTSIAMAIATLTGDTSVTPPVIADAVLAGGHRDKSGTSWSAMTAIPLSYNLKSTSIGLDIQKLKDGLAAGGVAIASMGPGSFTNAGHIIVIRGITSGGKFLVNDPNDSIPGSSNYQRKTNTEWEESTFVAEAKNYWVITK